MKGRQPILPILLGLAIAAIATGCRNVEEVAKPAQFHAEKLSAIDNAINGDIASGETPGAVVWIEHEGHEHVQAYGERSVTPERSKARVDTIYDVASLTKVIATTPAIMLLIEEDKVRLDAPVFHYIPDFRQNDKDRVTVRHLMTHTSGLRPGIGARRTVNGVANEWSGHDTAIEIICEEKLRSKPGKRFVYSDLNFILLGEIVQRVSGTPLDVFTRLRVFDPLRMNDTGYHPPSSKLPRIAPTERAGSRMLHGTVHDPTARLMGGVAGHAGLFSTAGDLARYCRMLLNNGMLDGEQIFEPETVRLMTSVQTPGRIDEWRGLGWDIDSPYAGQRGNVFPRGGYGHTGWTGPSLWIDPASDTFVIFMANRVHPDGKGNVIGLRRTIGTLAAEAIIGVDFSSVDRLRKVRNGIDVLEESDFEPVANLRVGLITNHTGLSRGGSSTIDLFHEAENVNLVKLFSPEHGIRGELDSKVDDSRDTKTGLKIHSLYGESRKPSAEQCADLDAFVFDIQDIGARYYTYVSTMGLAMEAAAENGLSFFVLDRVNPIGGDRIEGSVRRGESSFIAYHDIPIRHGMTIGELALMVREERGLELDLKIIEVEDWRRDMTLELTGLRWRNPSPNMRSLTEALLYPGIGLLETTALSVGRGTDTPFEVIGAPYIDDLELAADLNRLELPGLAFVPERFTPDASKFKDQECGGVRILLTDRDTCRIVEAGIAIAQVLNRLYAPDFNLDAFNRLLQDPRVIEGILSGQQPDQLVAGWDEEVAGFAKRREPYLLYR